VGLVFYDVPLRPAPVPLPRVPLTGNPDKAELVAFSREQAALAVRYQSTFVIRADHGVKKRRKRDSVRPGCRSTKCWFEPHYAKCDAVYSWASCPVRRAQPKPHLLLATRLSMQRPGWRTGGSGSSRDRLALDKGPSGSDLGFFRSMVSILDILSGAVPLMVDVRQTGGSPAL